MDGEKESAKDLELRAMFHLRQQLLCCFLQDLEKALRQVWIQVYNVHVSLSA